MGITATASAFSVTMQTQQWYEWGRLYDYDSSTDTFESTNLNPYDDTDTQHLDNGVYMGADTTEDSWGMATVSGIFETGTTNYFYDRATDLSELTMFYSNGIDVMAKFLDSETSKLYSEGFVARFYLDSDWDYDPQENYIGRGSDYDGNIGADYYKGSTEGTLVLELTGHVRYLDYSGTEADDGDTYQLVGTGNLTTGDVGGVLYLDVTDGIWADLFDTNTWDMSLLGGYGYADFRLTTTMWPNIGSSDWNLEGVGTAQGFMVPEPGTMILLGLGLLGLAGFGRRKAVQFN